MGGTVGPALMGGQFLAEPRMTGAPREAPREDAGMIETSGIDHVVLHVDDIQRSKKFYTEIFGMTPYREDDGQVFLHAGQQGLALFKNPVDAPLKAGNDLNHLALNVAAGSYETIKAELENQGVAVTGRPGQERCI